MSTLGKSARVANPTYTPEVYAPGGYSTFRSFYPYYLGEHSNAICRRLHLVGTTISLGVFTRALVAAVPLLATTKDRRLDVLRFGDDGFKSIARLLLGGLLQGYVWAWFGHFFFEKNRPATFKHPFYSFVGDLTLWKEVMTFQRRP